MPGFHGLRAVTFRNAVLVSAPRTVVFEDKTAGAHPRDAHREQGSLRRGRRLDPRMLLAGGDDQGRPVVH
eukprot:454000-Pyramimonas_sp.AAC.1